ncbi:MAG TPA: hypothetical protein DD670_06080 [Planctomycetaceae bacterium]|nr:hypothetical protein [Planctomycetaceae bacterium]
MLASIVGIPMLLAVWYVARSPEGDEELKNRRGTDAAWIFWVGTFLVAVGVFFAVHAVLPILYPPESDGPSLYFGKKDAYLAGWSMLALQFFFAAVAANATNNLVRKKKWYWRIPLVVLCVAVYLFVLFLPELIFRRPAINVMQFLVCMCPAHFWGRFKDAPNTRRAWWTLVAFLAAATMFFLVSYFGEDFAQWICGPPPTRWK